MARVVDALETAYAARLKKRKHPLLGSATISVGTISGGTQANIVPDRCESLVDRRTLPGETEPSALTDLKNICERSGLEIIQVEYLSGFFTQKLIDLERRVARTLGGALAAVALYPFRPLSRFDRFVEFEPLCIAIVAEKR